MNKELYRQGDVLIERIASIPKTGVTKQKPENGRIILAHGEVTGHHHSLRRGAGQYASFVKDADWWKEEGSQTQYVSLHSGATLVHQEHGAIALPKGNYRVRRQREYSSEAIRNVAD